MAYCRWNGVEWDDVVENSRMESDEGLL
jgi:hypothetical protein